MKYAVARALAGARYEEEDVGVSLQRVLRYWTLRGKFEGIHPRLAQVIAEGGPGIARVEVTMQGLQFIKNT